jgi:tetratricopeptide (TPR) repeat protein
MSFFKMLFGGTFDSNFDEAKILFDDGHLGEAKLSLERALAKAKGVSEARVAAARGMVGECKLRLARQKIAEADEAAASGDLEGAVYLLKDAREICSDAEILEAIQGRFKRYEAEDTRRLVEEVDEISEDELMTIIAGTWTDAQAEEYAAMPESLREALISSHDGDHEKSVAILREILASGALTVSPRYLRFELGKELVLSKQYADALEMLDGFSKEVEDDDGAEEVRVAACDLKAAALSALERFDEAAEALRAASVITPEDHRVFLKLGIFLRSREKFESSVLALETARELMGQMQPDFTVIRELGFTYLAMGRKKEAMDCFKAVVEHLASRGEHDQFDPETTIALAALHEDLGEVVAAADLYRHLAVGYDTRNHFTYNLEAARLLKKAAKDFSLADRYLTRARELAATDEQRAKIDEVAAL